MNTSRHKDRKEEPMPNLSIDDPPLYLTGLAKEIWEGRAPRLIRMGILTECDRDIFAMYCIKFARFREAEEKLKEEGEIVETPNGYLQQSPYLAIANKAYEHALKIATEFGMTPSSRSKVSVERFPERTRESKYFESEHFS